MQITSRDNLSPAADDACPATVLQYGKSEKRFRWMRLTVGLAICFSVLYGAWLSRGPFVRMKNSYPRWYGERAEIATPVLPADQIVWRTENWDTTVFKHGRRSPDGRWWIITTDYHFRALGAHIGFDVAAKPVYSIFYNERVRCAPGLRQPPRPPSPPPHLAGNVDVVYAGQIDADDDAHWTIDYELDSRRGTIDGWVLNGGKFRLEARTGPLTRQGLSRTLDASSLKPSE